MAGSSGHHRIHAVTRRTISKYFIRGMSMNNDRKLIYLKNDVGNFKEVYDFEARAQLFIKTTPNEAFCSRRRNYIFLSNQQSLFKYINN